MKNRIFLLFSPLLGNKERERDTGIGPKRSNDGYALDEVSDLVFNAVALC